MTPEWYLPLAADADSDEVPAAAAAGQAASATRGKAPRAAGSESVSSSDEAADSMADFVSLIRED